MHGHVLAVLALLAPLSTTAVTAEVGTTRLQQRANLTRTEGHSRLRADECAYVRNKGATSCRVTSVLTSWDGDKRVVRPFRVDTPAGREAYASNNCRTERNPCHASVRLARDYVWLSCFGCHSTSPVWWKVRQRGRYWRVRTCEYSLRIIAPHNCEYWANWTHDHNWRRHHFRPRREGFHVCQRVSSSGFTVEIDRCWVSGQRDPADVRSRYTRDRWRADAGWVGMRFTRCYFPHQCRTQTRSLTLGVAGWVTRHPTRG